MNRKTISYTAAVLLLLAARPVTATVPEGETAKITASGVIKSESGSFMSGSFQDGSGNIDITAVDYLHDRITPLPPHDQLAIKSTVKVVGHTFDVIVDRPMVNDPSGRFTTWQGTSIMQEHHGLSGIGTSKLPNIRADFLAFGLGNIAMDGTVVARGVPVHVMTAETGLPGKLELDVGDEASGAIPGLPDGHLRILWDNYQATLPLAAERNRIIGGVIFLILLLIGAFALNRLEPYERELYDEARVA